MPSSPPPNDALADLAAVLGVENVRTLVRTFLRDFPLSFRELGGGERQNRHRIAHSLKSNSRLMGAHALSQRMAEIELRLSEENGRDVTAEDLAGITADFEAIAGPLRDFVSDAPLDRLGKSGKAP
jgi:HPt (histidine-containing phosphotransfer) domain-containing protein